MAMTDITARHFHANRPARRGFALMRMIDVWRSRRALRALDDAALRDIGLSPRDAATEAARPIWDVPHTWKQD